MYKIHIRYIGMQVVMIISLVVVSENGCTDTANYVLDVHRLFPKYSSIRIKREGL
jgi:hypothetical protein